MVLKIFAAIFEQKAWELSLELFFLTILLFLFFPMVTFFSHAVPVAGAVLLLVLLLTVTEKFPVKEVMDDL